MQKKKTHRPELEPYWSNPNVSLFYELKWGNEQITPGMLIKIKHDRNQYRFNRLVVDSSTGKEWVDVLNMTLGGFYSFYVDRIQGPVYKRSRAKKQ